MKRLKKTSLSLAATILLAILSLPESAQAAACAPTSSTSGSTTKLTFSTAGTCQWTVPSGVRYMKFLIVAGGGGGGGGAYGGGGGGGAVITSTSISVTAGVALNVTVGNGGAGGEDSIGANYINNEDVAGANGGDSSIGSYIAKGGGGGAGYFTAPFGSRNPARGKIGGNQGGGSENSYGYVLPFDSPTNQPLASALSTDNKLSLFANHHGGDTLGASYLKAGGGGGGAETPGEDVIETAVGGDGGEGALSTFTGTQTYFGGGGGGGVTNHGSSYQAGDGGLGGGGDGGVTGPGEAAVANTGGGGGGAGFNGSAQFGGNGGSGLVVISYRTDTCIENGACSIGDEGPAAGVIFYIDTATNVAYEAAPRYWQSTCATGGICNIGDVGFAGGAIFSTKLGSYREASPGTWYNSGNAYGTQYQYDASAENAYFYTNSPGKFIPGRWRDASLSDYGIMYRNLYLAGLYGLNGNTNDDFYWTTDIDSQSNNPYVINPRSGQVEVALFTDYWMKLIGEYSAVDSSEQYTDDNSWSSLLTGKAIGTGRSNTELMINSSVSGAAHIADSLTVNSKSDWFLPSHEEMKALARQSSLIDGTVDVYWTSSTVEANRRDYAYIVNLSLPNSSLYDVKEKGYGIRPVRSFSIVAASAPGLTLAMNSGLRTAVFRVSNTITATSTESGRVTFYADGKKIAGCIGLATSSNAVSCSWKPAIRKAQRLTAVLKTTGGQYSTIQDLMVSVVSRTTRR